MSCSHLAIPAKLHGPKGDRINESLLYIQITIIQAELELHSNDI